MKTMIRVGILAGILVTILLGYSIKAYAVGRGDYRQMVWSPDMQKVAFLEVVSGKKNLMVANSKGSNIKRLTSGFVDQHPAWSPDGNRIAFVREIAGDKNYIYSSFVIYVINADGTDLKELVPESTAKKAWQSYPTWSPDGKKVAYADGKALFVVNADGSDATVLMSESVVVESLCPAWSPDGKWLAITKSSHPTSITLISTNGDLKNPKFTQIIKNVQINRCATWAPDAKKLAFVGTGRLYTINVDGSAFTDVGVKDAISLPKWSPDGNRIAFIRSVLHWGGESYFIGTINFHLGHWNPELVHKEEAIYNYSWSPDGKLLTYDLQEVYVINADGSDPHPFPFEFFK